MEISAITPLSHTGSTPNARQDVDVVTSVNKMPDGSHKVSQDYYVTTLYDRNGSVQTVQRSFSLDYTV